MKIVIEDYNGNDLCEIHIKISKDGFDLYYIEKLVDCNIADADTDDNGEEYLRIQLDYEN